MSNKKDIKEVKLTNEEWEALKELQTKYNTTMVRLGEVAYQKRILEPQLNEIYEIESSLLQQIELLRNEQEKVAKELNEKYGEDGIVNLATGIFKPTTD